LPTTQPVVEDIPSAVQALTEELERVNHELQGKKVSIDLQEAMLMKFKTRHQELLNRRREIESTIIILNKVKEIKSK
jgi:hypothetical protein